jgi:hypothetical protein
LLLCCDWRQTRVDAQHQKCEQAARSRNSIVHKQLACKKESVAQSLAALFMI